MIFEEFSSFKYDNNDEKFAEEYVMIYSRFLSTTHFGFVKDKIADLARRGHTRSLAKYIRRVSPKDWDEDLKVMALAIKNGSHQKTPQEWEVVAALDWHEPVQDCAYEQIKTVKDLRQELLKVGAEYYKADAAFKKKKIDEATLDEVYTRGVKLMNLYEKQPYLNSLRKCQEGYYSAFVEHQNAIDGVGFLEFTLEPDDLYIPYDNFKNYGDGVVYSVQDISNVLIKNFNDMDKNEDCTNEELYAFAFALSLYGKDIKEKKFGVRTLNLLGSERFSQAKAAELEKTV